MTIEQKAIDTLKMNGIAAVNKAKSGHPGIVLGAAKIMHTLFTRHLRISKSNPTWVNRDRFIMAAGHGSALVYSMFEKIGFIKMKDLKEFRQWKSLTPGHPEFGHTKGVDATSGPLGQGISTAVGMAVGEAHLNARFKEIDHYTYALCGDGDLQEGVSYESMSFAGRQQLNKLIILHDSNDIQLDTEVKVAFKEDLKKRVQAMGWNYIKVSKNEVEKIDKAITKAKKSKDKPTFIEVKTIIGEGATKQGTSGVHGAPLGDDIETVKKYLDWTEDGFYVSKETRDFYQETIVQRGEEVFKGWKASKKLQTFLTKEKVSIKLDITKDIATRVSSSEVVKYLNKNVEQWIGGSADLSCSTKVAGGNGDFMPEHRKGRNIMFGVREFAMASIASGLALHSNFKPFVSTFFVFTDYMKPAMRLAALMKLPVTYIMTHDSIFVGEDGPTHEPIEQLAMCRSIPNFNVIRPADEKEVVGAYDIALNAKETPTLIVLTRQNIKSLDETKQDVSKGGYVILKGSNDKTIIATGSELALAYEVGKATNSSVVSMPSTNLFDKQSQKYKDSVIKNYDQTLTLELATTFGWSKYGKNNFGLDRFGESAPGPTIYDKLGFNVKNITKLVNKM